MVVKNFSGGEAPRPLLFVHPSFFGLATPLILSSVTFLWILVYGTKVTLQRACDAVIWSLFRLPFSIDMRYGLATSTETLLAINHERKNTVYSTSFVA